LFPLISGYQIGLQINDFFDSLNEKAYDGRKKNKEGVEREKEMIKSPVRLETGTS